MKKLITSVVAIGVLMVNTPNATAHAILVDSNPKASSVLSKLPMKVWLEFDGNLITFGKMNINKISIKGPKGEYAKGNPIIGGARITTLVKSIYDKGNYSITWRVISEDGHPVTGRVLFTVI